MIKVTLKQRSDKTIDDWDNIRMIIELPGELPQLFRMTRDQIIGLDLQLFDYIISDKNNIDREITIAGTTVKLSPLMISAIHSKTSEYVHSWAMTAFENDWLEEASEEEQQELCGEIATSMGMTREEYKNWSKDKRTKITFRKPSYIYKQDNWKNIGIIIERASNLAQIFTLDIDDAIRFWQYINVIGTYGWKVSDRELPIGKQSIYMSYRDVCDIWESLRDFIAEYIEFANDCDWLEDSLADEMSEIRRRLEYELDHEKRAHLEIKK